MISMASMHQGKLLPPSTGFQPQPEIPAHVYQELASYGEKHGVDLQISWDGWRGYWAVLQRGRVWVGPGDDDYELRTFHVVDLVVETIPGAGYYKAIPLHEGDSRLLAILDSCFMGDTRTEFDKFREKRRREREKAKFDNDVAEAQAFAEESHAIMTSGSVEHALGKDKVHSGPGMGPKS